MGAILNNWPVTAATQEAEVEGLEVQSLLRLDGKFKPA